MTTMNRYTEFPATMFRLNTGAAINLRPQGPQGPERRKSFDLVTGEGDLVEPIRDLKKYMQPNGASMRPEGKVLTSMVGTFKGKNVMVYKVPKGTLIPKDLVLIHEHTDHYSLQPARKMSVKDLNKTLQDFYDEFSTVFERDSWLARYTKATTATTATTASTTKPKEAKPKEAKPKDGKSAKPKDGKSGSSRK